MQQRIKELSKQSTPPSRPTPPPKPTPPPPPQPQPPAAPSPADSPESRTASQIYSELEQAGKSPSPEREASPKRETSPITVTSFHPHPESADQTFVVVQGGTSPIVRAVHLASPGLNTVVAEDQSVLNSLKSEAGRPVQVSQRASPVPFPNLPFAEQLLDAEGDEKEPEPSPSPRGSETGTMLGNQRMNQYIRDQQFKRFGPNMPRFEYAPTDLQSTAPSQWSMMARYRQPIGRATIVQLKQIKRRMGAKVELFSDASMLGFDRKEWEKKLFQKHPLDFSEGFKKNLGTYVKTNLNKNKKSLSFIARRKATPYQLNALIGYIEGKTPPFHYLDRKSTRLNSSHKPISYAVFCLKKKIPSSPMSSYTTTHITSFL